MNTLYALRTLCNELALSHFTIPPGSTTSPAESDQVVFLLNFTTAQRSYLLSSPNIIALLYTPANEHFGIVPIESMACGLRSSRPTRVDQPKRLSTCPKTRRRVLGC